MRRKTDGYSDFVSYFSELTIVFVSLCSSGVIPWSIDPQHSALILGNDVTASYVTEPFANILSIFGVSAT